MTDALPGIGAVLIAYLLGSIPSAYIAGRLVLGSDVRKAGHGIVGGRNVFRQAGIAPAVAVSLADIGKGVAAVAIAHWAFGLPQVYVLLAGVAAVAGHLWMVFLKFSGGGAIGTGIGVVSTVLPVYGYSPELLFFLATVVVGLAITRNVAVGMMVGLLFLPLVLWLGTHSLSMTLFGLGVGVIIAAKRVRYLRAEISQAGNLKNYMFQSSFTRHKG